MQQNTKHHHLTDYLPTSRKEVKLRNWDTLDVILFSGDAYVDHPAFGAAVIGRLLESLGLRVAIVPQPNWQDDGRDFKKLGQPRLFFGVTSGNMDSMVNHYTANKRLRSNDAYTAGGESGFRPDYATVIYTHKLKQFFPETPVVIGGIEASLRRLTHYDYWADTLKPSILEDSGADLLVYGMAEKALTELAQMLQRGVPFSSLKNIPQTAFRAGKNDNIPTQKHWNNRSIASHEQCLNDKLLFARNFRIIEEESNKRNAYRLIQNIGDKQIIVNPPYPEISRKEIDAIYDLPFTRLPHPRYNKKDSIPAYEMIRHSITIHRGCFGGCSFCTISAHQGKFIVSRSDESVLREVEKVVQMPDFKGFITDLGGPSANMYQMQGKNEHICKKCSRNSCIFPTVCTNLEHSHQPLLNLYRKVRKHQRIKKVTIGSGIRYDLLFDEKQRISSDKVEYLQELLRHHVSGRLKVAPEHTSGRVLKIMRKPSFALFQHFNSFFERFNRRSKLNLQLIPYFISSHPGSTEMDMAELAVETKALNFRLEQVQDFTPTPMTLATVIYYSGYDPYTEKPVYTARSKNEKQQQRQYFFWYKEREKLAKRLKSKGRYDLAKKLFAK